MSGTRRRPRRLSENDQDEGQPVEYEFEEMHSPAEMSPELERRSLDQYSAQQRYQSRYCQMSGLSRTAYYKEHRDTRCQRFGAR